MTLGGYVSVQEHRVMPKVWEVGNMKLNVNTKEATTERPHVHLTTGRGRKNDAKIWLAPHVTLGTVKGEFDAGDISDALKIADTMRERFIAEYKKVHGEVMKRTGKKAARRK